jgi:peptide deformylase
MALRNILIEGDETLRKKSRSVENFNKRLADLLDDLKETAADVGGAGLAAPQVGILRRAVIIMHEGEYLELVNPEIKKRSKEEVGQFEGCLSCPDKRGYLMRPQKVTVRAQDRNGEWFETECEETAARAACHEVDHLDGVLFTDLVDKVLTEDEVEELLERLAEEQDGEDMPE